MSNVSEIGDLITRAREAYGALSYSDATERGLAAEKLAAALAPFGALPEPSAKLPEIPTPPLAFARKVALLSDRGDDGDPDAVETLAGLIGEARELTGVTEDDLPECLSTGNHLSDGRGMCRFGCGKAVTA